MNTNLAPTDIVRAYFHEIVYLCKIGELLKIGREQVRQIEREAIAKLRKRRIDICEYFAS